MSNEDITREFRTYSKSSVLSFSSKHSVPEEIVTEEACLINVAPSIGSSHSLSSQDDRSACNLANNTASSTLSVNQESSIAPESKSSEERRKKSSVLQLPTLLAVSTFASSSIASEIADQFSGQDDALSSTLCISHASIRSSENEIQQRRERKTSEHKPRLSGWKTLPPKFLSKRPAQDSAWSSVVKNSRKLQDVENVTVDDPKIDEIFAQYEWPFENMVFEGGGHKAMAYVGAMKVLEKAGIMKNIKRVSGAGAGAITATLVAIGYDAEDIRDFCEEDTHKILIDHKCGLCSLIPNLFRGYGWNPGERLFKWFGEKLEEVTGSPDITFLQVYKMFGCELCIVVTNLNHLCTEYFHLKTTPNTPVRKAVRMSCALPGVYQPVRVKDAEFENIYVDGGLLCSYPVHTYDGWWLSLDKEDSFFKKLQPLENLPKLFEKSERFGSWNQRTLGLLLYSDRESDHLKRRLTEREDCSCPKPPDTKLARLRYKQRCKREETLREHSALVTAVSKMIKELHRSNADQDEVISREEFSQVFEDPIEMTQKDFELIFGEGVDCQSAFDSLDTDLNGQISYDELMAFVEGKGIQLQGRFLGYQRKDIKNFADFLGTLKAALSVNVKKMYVEDKDVDRTIGIDTDYIEATDFKLDVLDKVFLVETGARGTRAFLREYLKKNISQLKTHSTESLPEKNTPNQSQTSLSMKKPQTSLSKSHTYFSIV